MTAPSSLSAVEQTIVANALANGVDPRLALSTAQVESGLNPTSVGDGGTSFGLYQLHQGGELGSLTPAQAFNPDTNSHVALSVFGQVIKAHPGVTDPGTIAALSQRPADPTGYAAKVDAVYNNPSAFPQIPAGATQAQLDKVDWTKIASGVGSAVGGAIAGPGGAAVGGAVAGGGAALASGAAGLANGSWSSDVFKIVLDAVFTAAALGLILLGLTRLFPGAMSTIRSAVPLAAL